MDPWLGFDPETLPPALVFGAGALLGLVVGALMTRVSRMRAETLARNLFEASEDRHRTASEAMLERIAGSFGRVSVEAMNRSSEHLLDLADVRLDAERSRHQSALDQKKVLIDAQLERMGGELDRVRRLVTDLERSRASQFGELTQQLRTAQAVTERLDANTSALRDALRNSPKRGQWGERLAVDLLTQAGFVEGVNFTTQEVLANRGRPDVTFLLPGKRRLFMDVKFPFDNYVRFLEAPTKAEGDRFERQFLQDVRQTIRELAARDYAAAEPGTLAYVLLFIPNEPVFAFLHDRFPGIADEAIARGVVLCAPSTLFAILAVIREAVDQFIVSNASDSLLGELDAFGREWTAFKAALASLGQRIDGLQSQFQVLSGTRVGALDRPLARLDKLRFGASAGALLRGDGLDQNGLEQPSQSVDGSGSDGGGNEGIGGVSARLDSGELKP